MGLSYGQSSSQNSQNTSQTANKTFSAPQSALQSQLGSSLSSDLSAASGGSLSPGVQAGQTQAADQINKTSGGLTDRVNKFLAARGFGQSGQTGKATLAGELGRESDLANNAANFAGEQSQLDQGKLLAALNYAFTQIGQTGTGTQSGTSSGSQFGAQVSGSMSF